MADAASEKAEEVIAERAYTLVPDDYFEELLAALDSPAEIMPELAAASARVMAEPAFQRA